jgi:protein-tyrosine phosphatase
VEEGDYLTDQERVDKLHTKIIQTHNGETIGAYDLVYDNIYVGMAPNEDGSFPHVDAVLNLRAESQVTLNCKATLWMPIWDRPPFPGVDWLAQAVSFLEVNQKHNWTTYIHCNLGYSRSGMVTVAFVMKEEKLKLEPAWKIINDKRACGPNPSFILGLIEWERFLEGKD